MSRTDWVHRLLVERGPLTAAAVGAGLRAAGVVSPEQCTRAARNNATARKWPLDEQVRYGSTQIACQVMNQLVRTGRARVAGRDNSGRKITEAA